MKQHHAALADILVLFLLLARIMTEKQVKSESFTTAKFKNFTVIDCFHNMLQFYGDRDTYIVHMVITFCISCQHVTSLDKWCKIFV